MAASQASANAGRLRPAWQTEASTSAGRRSTLRRRRGRRLLHRLGEWWDEYWTASACIIGAILIGLFVFQCQASERNQARKDLVYCVDRETGHVGGDYWEVTPVSPDYVHYVVEDCAKNPLSYETSEAQRRDWNRTQIARGH